ncbi:MAG: DUF2188 domain-containing protein [Nitriliruptorales bacterium]
MSGAGKIHVREREGRWVVEQEGRSEPVSEHVLQAEAIEAGRELAAREGVEFLLHGAGDWRVTARESANPTPAAQAKSADTDDHPDA